MPYLIYQIDKPQKYDNILGWQDCGKRGFLIHGVVGKQNGASPIWREFGNF